ncbi:MAG TPA: 16S rRNA (cytidine(1402)-2'-O)-methyltransferase [Polyangiaceae bacterium]
MRTLYVVGTPIGNLGDLSARVREVLASCSRVFAEDTRRTKALLAHLGISGKPVLRFDAHATPARSASLIADLAPGDSAALVTDAGMPGVSDPGAELVRAAAREGVRIVPVPGPSAVTAALAASGLVGGPFSFLAFLPRQGKKRRAALERIASAEEPVVLFEAPSRIADTLRELAALEPERPAALCRELTKLHEEVIHASLGELAALEREWLGEITLVVSAGSPRAKPESADPADVDREIAERLAKGAHPRDLSSELARRLGVPRRTAYQRVLAIKNG